MQVLRRLALLIALACLVSSGYAADVKPLPFVPGSWTLVLLPDTQHYARRYPKTFISQTKWIVDNAAERNIAFVMGEGDVTNDNTPEQWANAKAAFSLLDGKVPYALQLGNHDYKPKPLDKRATLANKYFPPELVQKSPAYGGAYEKDKLDNAYYLFSAGGRDWIALSLEFTPRDGVVKWANKVLAENANRSAIICTHSYLRKDGTRFGSRSSQPKMVADVGKNSINHAEKLWQKLVSKHANVVFVFCGHVGKGGAARLASKGDAGNTVHQILADYQRRPNGGEGYMRLVEFLPDGKTVQVKTYSSTKDDYLTDAAQQFTLEIAPAVPKPVPAAVQADQTGRVFRENLPGALAKEVDRAVLAFKNKHPLSSDGEKGFREAVAGLNLEYASLSKGNEMRIREAGPSAIPVIADLLASQDKELRYRALVASVHFLKTRERITEGYTDVEALLVLLYRRSLFDTDAEVRTGAVGCLYNVAYKRFPKIPPSIEPALREAWKNDPDAGVRKRADLVLQDLRMIPRDPKREGYP